jgi:hypothetical protein
VCMNLWHVNLYSSHFSLILIVIHHGIWILVSMV